MEARLHELIALAALAALGCGLALEVGDLFFGAIFGAAGAVATTEAIRRSPCF
jgi:alkylhydroperoxidase/carboxymuconolactone decarboxylase family protein YurZ